VTAWASLTRPEVRVARLGGDVAVVSLLGEHDLATAAEVRSTLGSLLERGTDILVDLSETEFIDLSVVRALDDGQRLASEHGSRMSFQLQTDTIVSRVLELCGLLHVWLVYGSYAEAIAARLRENGRASG
jgi:anti-anti-sigma factor